MKTILLALGLIASLSAAAQDCGLYRDLRKTGTYELTTYDAKQQPTGRVRQEVRNVKASGGRTQASVHQQVLDKQNQPVSESEFGVECQAGLVRIDMRSMLNPEQMKGYKDMELTATGDFLELPATPKAGSTLPDGTLNLQMSDKKSGTRLGNMRMLVSNRKVEATDAPVTTPAGSFRCVKVSQDLRMETGIGGMSIPVTMRSVEWYAPGVGSVRSETYRKDKLMGYTVLTAKP
ncbi:TapB family protein [Solirubrum puertoriconensis]|uniref:DUF3108 domain-containing protein n=1 Tax=Solirubrum puertoriconensis TaxID=1751427 RepID=A0A9X0HHV0_SOLP1|nr:hypothetical protein [Solirubrum puertoriconensis]KUG06115.1 hypothetical protein ASU33_01745 [Solirubrum puertoriconensis]